MPSNTHEVVEVLERFSNELGWRFSYGNKANQNLLQSNFNADEIYMLLDPVTRQRTFGEYGGTGLNTFNGQFLLVVKSTIDQVYHNQTSEETFASRISLLEGGTIVDNACAETSLVVGKYTENIKPLLQDALPLLEDLINCSEYQITAWTIVDIIDVFDANTDGIVVTFNLSVL